MRDQRSSEQDLLTFVVERILRRIFFAERSQVDFIGFRLIEGSFLGAHDVIETGRGGRSLGYFAANMPTSITQGTRTIGFSYGADQRHFMQTAAEGTPLYFSVFGVRAELFEGSQWHECLMAGGASPAVLTIQPQLARTAVNEALALQLPFCFEVRTLGYGLVSSTPE